MTEHSLRIGVIKLSPKDPYFEDLYAEVNDTDLQGRLRDAGIFAKLQKKLLLPDEYKIVGIYFQPWSRDIWNVVVEHPSLPTVSEAFLLPEVRPFYQRLEDGSTVLLRIDIEGGTI